MTLSDLQQQKREGGFTLVELAIVMIIIGLLIGGILKGQELIANSQVTATIAQVKGYDAAMTTFRDKYNAVPGDMGDAQTRLPNCTAANSCNNAPGANDGNNRIDYNPGGVPAGEGLLPFVHLSFANLVSGIEAADGTIWGGEFPDAKVGGGFRLGYTANGLITGIMSAGDGTPGHYLALVFEADTAASTGGFSDLEAVQAGQIDRKLDDGRPDTGTVQADGSECMVTAGDAYNEGANDATCQLAIKIQG